MGCSASVAAEPDKPVSTATGRTSVGGSADGIRPALKSGPSMKGPKKGVSFRKKETDVLGPRSVAPAADSETADRSNDLPAASQPVASNPAAAEAETPSVPDAPLSEPPPEAPVETSPLAAEPDTSPAETQPASEPTTEQPVEEDVETTLKNALLNIPDSADVFEEGGSFSKAPGGQLLEKSNVNKAGNLKHFGVRQSKDRDMDAVAATQNLFKKSTGVVPKVFVESIFSTYDLNGDGTISQSELQGLAADLQANYGHLKHALIGDDNPDGTVTRDALMNWFYNDHSTQQMRTIFDQMDADGSGFIEAEEIPNVLKLCAENISEENIAIAMSTLDRDGDMKVSFEEFSHWFNNDCKLVTYRSFFSLYASNGDGKDKIGLAELKEMLVAMGGKEEHLNVQAVMDEIDTNKNGLVELEEFIAWSVKNN